MSLKYATGYPLKLKNRHLKRRMLEVTEDSKRKKSVVTIAKEFEGPLNLSPIKLAKLGQC